MAMNKNMGVDVILNDLKNNPHCEHGPSVLFERFIKNGKRIRYFACSACRDRKLCSFYQEEDEDHSKNNTPFQVKNSTNLKYHFERQKELSKMSCITEKERHYCASCSKFLQNKITNEHKDCFLITSLTNEQLSLPTTFLPAKENSKFESQYLFSDKSINTLISLINGINCKEVLCVGCPRIHEKISTSHTSTLKSFLLDIDNRFCSFFKPECFQLYNLFNHYFFSGEEGRNMYCSFLRNCNAPVIIIDPPFGGRVELIAHTIKQIEEDWKNLNESNEDKILPILLIFPYFLEATIVSQFPNITMLDYKVDYDNHPLYSTGPKGMKQGSAVRIFVNLPPNKFSLPESEGYKFCTPCQRWVYENNTHCDICRGCMSKDGKTYKHCSDCTRCVKPSWIHCDRCKRCQPKDHNCKDYENRLSKCGHCHICGRVGHKRRECFKRKKGDDKGLNKKKRKTLPKTLNEEKLRNSSILAKIINK